MKTIRLVIALLILATSCCLAAENSWTGKISDSTCGARHKGKAENPTSNLSDAQCTAACLKGGAKYVFVSGGKIYKIDNQDFAGLHGRAGQTVFLTGELTNDTIKASKVVPLGKEPTSEKSSL